MFDDNQDLILKADYILILGGGSITVRNLFLSVKSRIYSVPSPGCAQISNWAGI